MSETTINPNKTPLALSEAVEPIEPFTPPSGSLAGFHGELRPEYRRTPYMGIIQAVGSNSGKFPKNHGDILYASEKLVPRPVTISFFGLRTYYRQNLAFDANSMVRPMTYQTAAEVEEHEGNLRRGIKPGTDDHNYVPEALAFVILESPFKKGWASGIEQCDILDNKILVPAAWFLRGVSFTRIVDSVRMINNRLKKDGHQLARARFSLDTQHVPINGNWIYAPILTKQDEVNNDSYITVMQELFGE